MHKEESHSDLGTIKIHKNVIASIASLAAQEVVGVTRVGNNHAQGFLEFIGNKNTMHIKVEIDKNEEVRLDIPLVIKFGCNIPEIANKVQENVRNALEKMTSIALKDINIDVRGIEKG